jgi:sugar fermentation stimulation protein A
VTAFAAPLLEGRLVRRYKRFLADVAFPDGRVEVVHCPNPGAMLGLDAAGARAFVSVSDSRTRKLPMTLEILEADGTFVGINTNRPNGLFSAAILAGTVPELAGYDRLRREVPYGRASRVDIVLESPDRPPAYVEIKNVHLMRRPGLAEFPDCVTARGARHLVELAEVVASGGRAVMAFVVQRGDCDRVAIAADLDPAYARGFAAARKAGVEVIAYACRVTPDGIAVERAVPVLD